MVSGGQPGLGSGREPASLNGGRHSPPDRVVHRVDRRVSQLEIGHAKHEPRFCDHPPDTMAAPTFLWGRKAARAAPEDRPAA